MGGYTKGPWEAVKRASYDGYDYWMIQTATHSGGWELAEVRMDVPDADGNARVMAAAPDLLESLERLVSAARDVDSGYMDQSLASAEAAIARARGEA